MRISNWSPTKAESQTVNEKIKSIWMFEVGKGECTISADSETVGENIKFIWMVEIVAMITQSVQILKLGTRWSNGSKNKNYTN